MAATGCVENCSFSPVCVASEHLDIVLVSAVPGAAGVAESPLGLAPDTAKLVKGYSAASWMVTVDSPGVRRTIGISSIGRLEVW